jgi:hypothetical protein
MSPALAATRLPTSRAPSRPRARSTWPPRPIEMKSLEHPDSLEPGGKSALPIEIELPWKKGPGSRRTLSPPLVVAQHTGSSRWKSAKNAPVPSTVATTTAIAERNARPGVPSARPAAMKNSVAGTKNTTPTSDRSPTAPRTTSSAPAARNNERLPPSPMAPRTAGAANTAAKAIVPATCAERSTGLALTDRRTATPTPSSTATITPIEPTREASRWGLAIIAPPGRWYASGLSPAEG